MLRDRSASIIAERTTRQPLTAAEAKALLREVDEVWIARGSRIQKLTAKKVKADDLRGPTGNFRAPMLRRGRKLMVGFHAASVEELVD